MYCSYFALQMSGSHEYPTIVSTEIFDCFFREPSTEICLKVNSRWCLSFMCNGSLILNSSYQIGLVTWYNTLVHMASNN